MRIADIRLAERQAYKEDRWLETSDKEMIDKVVFEFVGGEEFKNAEELGSVYNLFNVKKAYILKPPRNGQKVKLGVHLIIRLEYETGIITALRFLHLDSGSIKEGTHDTRMVIKVKAHYFDDYIELSEPTGIKRLDIITDFKTNDKKITIHRSDEEWQNQDLPKKEWSSYLKDLYQKGLYFVKKVLIHK